MLLMVPRGKLFRENMGTLPASAGVGRVFMIEIEFVYIHCATSVQFVPCFKDLKQRRRDFDASPVPEQCPAESETVTAAVAHQAMPAMLMTDLTRPKARSKRQPDRPKPCKTLSPVG